jgi:hypothetical protein
MDQVVTSPLPAHPDSITVILRLPLSSVMQGNEPMDGNFMRRARKHAIPVYLMKQV